MSYCEDYMEPFAYDCEHGIPHGINCDDCADEGLEDCDDDEEWECAFPDRCLMPSPLHSRSECYTVEDAEAYYAEVEGI